MPYHISFFLSSCLPPTKQILRHTTGNSPSIPIPTENQISFSLEALSFFVFLCVNHHCPHNSWSAPWNQHHESETCQRLARAHWKDSLYQLGRLPIFYSDGTCATQGGARVKSEQENRQKEKVKKGIETKGQAFCALC